MYRKYHRTLTESSFSTTGYSSSTATDSGNVRDSLDKVETKQDKTTKPGDMEEVNKLKEDCLKNLKALAKKVGENKGVVVREAALEDVKFICSLYDMFENKLSGEDLQTFRKDVATIIMETSILKYLTKIIVAYPADVYSNIASYKDVYLLNMSIYVLSLYTGVSEDLAVCVAKTAVTRFCKRLLETSAEAHLDKNLSEMLEKSLRATTALAHRLSMVEANVMKLRDQDFAKAHQPYLKSHDDELSLMTLAVLANIITEEESRMLSANTQLVARLVYVLQKSIEKDSHTFEGWSAKKCCRAVRNLAKNDANKKLLWNLNVLHTLADLAQTGDEEEQLESVHAIWALAFDENIRKDIVNDKDSSVINMLQGLEQSTSNKDLKDACIKCMWTLGKNGKTPKEPSVQETVATKHQTPTPKEPQGHIMISYQSQNRQVLLEIKKILEEKDYKVWMDVDQMGGSTLQAMADGIENAAVVLLCYSRKYKESENCRLEAEYVHEQGKPFIPLKMERGYKPDGWLGLLIGSRYFVDFSGKYKFEDKLVDLFRELNRILEPEETTTVKGDKEPVVSNTSHESHKSNADGNKGADDRLSRPLESYDTLIESKRRRLQKLEQVRNWNKDDVLNWLNEHSLTNQGLNELTGEEISFLARVLLEAPDRIYDLLTKDLQVNTLLTKSRLVWALDKLSNDGHS